MSYDFNADDMFEMARQLERNGAIFYRAAADKVQVDESRELLLRLAAMEDDHEKTFIRMQEELKGVEKTPTVFDPDGEALHYLQALVDTRVFFEKRIDTSSMEAVLKDAITAEKDSIVFYLGMRDLVPERRGRDRLDEVIKEEMEHIRLLSRELLAQRR